ncbi:IS5 family transposase [Roseomonas marmotae]|uniref:IS5 family transposase n=1 Tax=Roseomonas marmotae TaxID=2768161 RepID=UPI0038D1BF51
MADLFWLTKAQIERISRYFPLSHGVPRADDQRVVSDIIHVIRNGLRWRDAPAEYGPHKALYNRIFVGLAGRKGQPDRLMIDAMHLKAHRTAASRLKRAVSRRIGRYLGDLNSKLHAITDGQGRPLIMLLSEGQMSDHKGAALMLGALPPARILIGDKGYDSDRFRQALAARGIEPCIPSRRGRKQRIPHDRMLYRQRHRIENMSGRLKDWRRIAMRYDRCAHAFMSAICLAATVLFWINEP